MTLIVTSRGQYSKATIKQNSLVQNALEKPAIYATMIRLNNHDSLTYLTEGTGRVKMFDTKQEEWGNKTFEWFIKGRGNRPSTVAGAALVGNGTARFTLPLNEDYLNKGEVVKLKSGRFAFVLNNGQGSGPFFYDFEIMDVDDNGIQYTFTSTVDAPVGSQISVYSNLNPENSDKGYGTISYPDKYIQYMSIIRRGLEITGSALGNVTWVTNTKTRQAMWYFEAEDEVQKQQLRHMDVWRMYGRNTIKSTGVPFLLSDGKPVYSGDGVLTQIEGINEYQFSQDTDITRKSISDYMAMLSTKAKDFDNNHWVLATGTRGATIIHQLFENSLIENGNFAYSYADGKPIQLGGNFQSYRMGSNTMSVKLMSLFDDETLHTERDSNGYLLESSRMVWLNFGQINNESNVIIAVRKSINGNRGLIKKYIPGMVDPFDIQQDAIAPNSSDGFRVEWLSESAAVVTNPFCCGQWIRKAS
jgi:hypothetical protein